MKSELPVILSDDDIRLILEGRKNQIRTPMNPQPEKTIMDKWRIKVPAKVRHKMVGKMEYVTGDADVWRNLPDGASPYGIMGGRLYVREAFYVLNLIESDSPTCRIKYGDGTIREIGLIVDEADGLDELSSAKRAMRKKRIPCVQMPRWASRIDLDIVDIRGSLIGKEWFWVCTFKLARS